jgi:predicted Zn-dependent peptidase
MMDPQPERPYLERTGDCTNAKGTRMIFEQTGTHELPDEKLVAQEYRHPLGLRHIHIPSSFPELGYALVFPTATTDDTGVPHILEHLTMCGSDRFRQKDPFFGMLDRTVAHELNAHTGRVATTYHYATTDAADYINMAQVYTDLAFNPLLRRGDFLREGWRLERDEQGAPKLNGVVLNEMLGAFGNPGAHIREALYRAIDASAPESRVSGGLPLAIPALSYEHLRDFHDAHYRPEAAILVTTGTNVPIGALHAVLDEALTRRAERLSVEPARAPAHPAVTAGARMVETLSTIDLPVNQDRPAQLLKIPGGADTPAQTFFVWRADWRSAPEDELYDQLLTDVLFNTYSPAMEQLKDALDGDVRVQFLHDLSRQGKKAGLVVAINGMDADKAARLGPQITAALEKAAREGAQSAAWERTLTQVDQDTRVPRPLHSHADNLAEALMAGLPLGQDHNNREVIARLRLDGTPTPEACAQWWARWAPAAVITTESDPNLMDAWRARLDHMAQAKWDAGLRPEKMQTPILADNELLPLMQIERLNPVPAQVAGLWNAAAGAARSLPSDEEEGALDRGEWITVEGAAGKGATGNGPIGHRHVRCSDEDPTRQASLNIDITDLPQGDQDLLRLYSLLADHLGRAGQDRTHTRRSEATALVHPHIKVDWMPTGGTRLEHLRLTCSIGVDSVRADGLGGPDACSWVKKIWTEQPDGNPAAWAQACKRVSAGLNQEREHLDRMEQTGAGEAFVDAKKRRTTDLGRINRLALLLREGAARPDVLHQQALGAWLRMKRECPRWLDTMGDRATLRSGEGVARNLATFISLDAKPVDSDGRGMDIVSGHSLHVPKPDAGNTCKRVFARPGLSERPADEVALMVAGCLIDPFLHEHIREQGGAYGARMSIQDDTVVLHSYRDPQTDSTYDTYDRAAQVLVDLCDRSDPNQLARAQLQVAQRLLNPGDGTRYRKAAIARHNKGYGRNRDRDLLDQLKQITWVDIRGVAATIDRSQTPYVDVAVGPDRPHRFDAEQTAGTVRHPGSKRPA